MERTVFKCTVDRKNRIITVLLTGLLVIVPAVLLAGTHDLKTAIASSVVLLILAVSVVIIYGNLPRRMVVTPDAILLNCPFRTKVIPRGTDTKVRRVCDYDTQALCRYWGSDGIFGKWGLFASKLYPRMHFYAKRSKRDWILVKSAGKVYVLSPDDGNAFLELFS